MARLRRVEEMIYDEITSGQEKEKMSNGRDGAENGGCGSISRNCVRGKRRKIWGATGRLIDFTIGERKQSFD